MCIRDSLGHIAELNELDTTGVEPMAQVGGVLGDVVETAGANLRADVCLLYTSFRAAGR